MNFEHRKEGGVGIVSINGNIALDGTSEVKEYLQPIMGDSELKGLILNFGKVNFIDSSGIGLVVSIFKGMQKQSAKFALTELNQKNREIFSMTRLDKILSISDTDDQALSVMQG